MRLHLTASVLRDLLSRARTLIPATPTLAAYSGVLLRGDADSGVSATASDGDSTIVVTGTGTVERAGQVLVAPKALLAFIGSVPASTELTLDVTAADLTVSGTGLNPYTFRGLSATFPATSSPAAGVRPPDLSPFTSALAAVRPAVARDSAAVQLVSDGDQLALHTTDGYRLARVVLPGGGFGTFTGLLPMPVLERAARAVPTEVTVDLRGRQVSFRGADTVVTSRMLAVPFPAVESVLASSPPPVTSFDRAPMASALARLSSIAEQGSLQVTFRGQEARLQASSAEVGAGVEVVALGSPVPAEFTVVVRAPFLVDAVDAFADGPVTVAYSGALLPLFLTAQSPLPLTHVVMPVRP